MKGPVKTLAYFFSYLLARLFSLFSAKKPAAIILMYHSFDETAWRYGVRPKELERQLAYLAKHKHVVPFEDVVAFVRGDENFAHQPLTPTLSHREREYDDGPLAPRERVGVRGTACTSVAITVDDVYADTYTVLFPLLKKYNIHATLFLTTDLSPREKFGNLSRPTWVQLKEMHDSGLVTVEVHGRTHVNWPEIENDKHRLAEEVLGARDDIIREIGYTPRFAAYPSGRRSRSLEAYLEEHGFESAVAITEGAVHVGDRPFALKRVQVDKTMSFLLFKLRLSPQTLRIVRTLRS